MIFYSVHQNTAQSYQREVDPLIENTFAREKCRYIACNKFRAFFTDNSEQKHYHTWTCEEFCKSLGFLIDNIFIRFGNEVYRQTVGIPMGTNCAPLVADLFLYCYERDFMLNLSSDSQQHIIHAFNSTSRYLDDILNIDNPYFASMISLIYPPELTLLKANPNDLEAAFLDLFLRITNGIVSTKIYDKRDDYNFDIVNYPQLSGDIPRATSYGVYISQLVRFARASTDIADFNERNRIITSKLLTQGFRYNKLRKTFSKFYRRYGHLLAKYNTSLKICWKEFPIHFSTGTSSIRFVP